MPTPFGMSITISGTEPALLMLSRFGEAAADIRPALKEIAADFRAMEREAFASQGANPGPAWAPLTPAYGAWKAAHFPGRPILVLRGDLQRSLTEAGGQNIERISAQEGVFGSAVRHGIFHQSGTARMVARPPIRVTKARRASWAKMIQAHLVAAARGKAA